MRIIHTCNFDHMGENWDVDEDDREKLNDLGREDPLAAAMLAPMLERQHQERRRRGLNENGCRCHMDDDNGWCSCCCPEHYGDCLEHVDE